MACSLFYSQDLSYKESLDCPAFIIFNHLQVFTSDVHAYSSLGISFGFFSFGFRDT
jgi:hypothetical protein